MLCNYRNSNYGRYLVVPNYDRLLQAVVNTGALVNIDVLTGPTRPSRLLPVDVGGEKIHVDKLEKRKLVFKRAISKIF